jgi:hypothetical protein
VGSSLDQLRWLMYVFEQLSARTSSRVSYAFWPPVCTDASLWRTRSGACVVCRLTPPPPLGCPPLQLLAQLAFERGSTDTASRAAELMGADLTRQLLSSSVGAILPPSHDARMTSAGPRRPLEVEVARFVARSSPQQAILAALLGSKGGQEQGEQEGGGREEARRQGLSELALELADRWAVTPSG